MTPPHVSASALIQTNSIKRVLIFYSMAAANAPTTTATAQPDADMLSAAIMKRKRKGPIGICLAGEGAQGVTHFNALQTLGGRMEVVSVAGGVAADTAAFAAERGIVHHSLDFEECLAQPGVEAVILGTPNQLHAEQAELALQRGKHVLIEIPMALTLADRSFAPLDVVAPRTVLVDQSSSSDST